MFLLLAVVVLLLFCVAWCGCVRFLCVGAGRCVYAFLIYIVLCLCVFCVGCWLFDLLFCFVVEGLCACWC